LYALAALCWLVKTPDSRSAIALCIAASLNVILCVCVVENREAQKQETRCGEGRGNYPAQLTPSTYERVGGAHVLLFQS
jgi:hypothetical protein